MATIEAVKNLYKIYTIDVSGGFRAVHKIGFSKFYNEDNTINTFSLIQALEDVLEGITVLSYNIHAVDYDGHIEHGKRYYISVETLQGKNNEAYTMKGYIVYNGTYDTSKLK